MRRNVGFIGLGDHDATMAQALAPSRDLFLWARREASNAPLEGLKFHRAKSATALANQIEVLSLLSRTTGSTGYCLRGSGRRAASQRTGHKS